MMGKAIDSFIDELAGELRIGGAATLDDLYDLALAIQSDLKLSRKPHKRSANMKGGVPLNSKKLDCPHCSMYFFVDKWRSEHIDKWHTHSQSTKQSGDN